MRRISAPSKAAWSRQRRLEFIDFRLLWDESVSRQSIVERFGISTQQASSDLAEYLRLAPENLRYDTRLKTYRAKAQFVPIFVERDAPAFLAELASIASGASTREASSIGWFPPYELVRFPQRPVSFSTLKSLLGAIRGGTELCIEYQSMRRPHATARWIAPHALAFDGQRSHVRAWCYENGDFRDFVISRFGALHGSRTSKIDSGLDDWWHAKITVLVEPSSSLSASQRRAIERDYGMKNGHLRIQCRKALAFYVLRQLRLDQTEGSGWEQPLRVVRSPEVVEVLDSGRKSTQQRKG